MLHFTIRGISINESLYKGTELCRCSSQPSPSLFSPLLDVLVLCCMQKDDILVVLRCILFMALNEDGSTKEFKVDRAVRLP